MTRRVCEVCGKPTTINWGNAYTVICKACHSTDAARQLLAMPLSTKSPSHILATPALDPTHLGELLSARPVLSLAIAGTLAGGLLGCLARPSAPLIGQLPFEIVITRGATLKGFDQMLASLAQSSFNTLMGASLVGAVVGAIVGRVLLAQRKSV
jgi:hypothetical protein